VACGRRRRKKKGAGVWVRFWFLAQGLGEDAEKQKPAIARARVIRPKSWLQRGFERPVVRDSSERDLLRCGLAAGSGIFLYLICHWFLKINDRFKIFEKCTSGDLV
jgi:hypothetical protein